MIVKNISDPNETIRSIAHGEEQYLKKLYNQYRKEFMIWAKKYFNIDTEVAGDIYQQAFISFYYNVKEGKITEMRSSIKTYLFAIGKNLAKQHHKSTNKFVDSTENIGEDVDESITKKYEQAALKEDIRTYLNKIGEPCKSVIELFYFRQYSMEAIALELGYKTEQIAAKRKFICLKQLKELMKANHN